MDQKEQIEAMNLEVSTLPPKTKAPGTTAPGTTAPGTKAPGTNAPSTKAPSTKAPGTSAPSTKPPHTEAPKEDEKEVLRKENESLQQKLAEALEKQTAGKEAEVKLDDVDFLAQIQEHEISNLDKRSFNAILNQVHKAGVKTALEHSLKAMPRVVKASVEQQVGLTRAVETFYTNNKDLLPFKKTVGTIAEEFTSKHPEWTIEKLFEETEKEARKRLVLFKKTQQENTPPPKGKVPPAVPKKPGQSKPGEKAKVSPLQKQIDEMNSSLNE